MQTSAYRLSLVYAGTFATALTLLVAVIYFLTARFIDDEVDAAVESEFAGLLDAYQRGGARRLASELEFRRNSWGRNNAVSLLADSQGTVIAGNLSSWPLMRQLNDRWVEFEILTREGGAEVNHPVRGIAMQLPGDLRLLVGTDLGERQLLMRRFAVAAGVGLGLVTLLAIGIGYRQSRMIMERVASINRSCGSILAGNLSQRLPVIGVGDEFDTLAREFNELLDRLARTTEILRASLHSAAHDLRSPMHRMRLRMEQALGTDAGSAPKDNVEALLRDLDHMQKVLTALLQIAEAESGALGAQPGPVAMDTMLGQLRELYQPQAEEQRVTLESEADAKPVVTGHRQLLAQAVANLVDNALKFTPPGGRVCLAAHAAGDRLVVSVADNGPGIPEADRNRALEPFVRLGAGASREGAGLGLSLVAAVARLHGGVLRLRDNAPGLRAELVLPVARSAPAGTVASSP